MPSPLAISSLGNATSVITQPAGFLVVIILLIVSLIFLVVHWLRSTGVERAQFRWLFLGSLLFLFVLVMGQVVPEDAGPQYLFLPAGFAIPVTIGIAILRYRLYDIDRIISRTVSYTLVVGLLALVVLGLVAILAVFLPSDDPLVVAFATLVAAALFNPVRRRLQRVVDRRFNRSRYDAERVIDQFAGSLRHRVDPEAVVDGWVGTVDETMQPSSLGVWVRRS